MSSRPLRPLWRASVAPTCQTPAMKWAFVTLVATAVGIAVGAELWSEGYSWEGVLTGIFCALPVFFIGTWLVGRREVLA